MYDRIRVFRSDEEDGTYVEITDVSTRLVLTTALTDYLYIDTTGTTDHWYKYQFSNSGNANLSDLSGAFQGASGFENLVFSVDDLKQFFLFGLPLYDPRTLQPLPDSFFEFYIRSSISYVEKILDIDLSQKTRLNEKHDYVRPDYERFMYLQLLHQPVISVEEVRISVDGRDETAIALSTDGYRLDNVTGQLENMGHDTDSLVTSLGISTAWIPLHASYYKYAPQIFAVDYTSGFTPGNLPPELKELVGRVAALGPLTILGDLIHGAGVAGNQVSVDMLATRINTTKSDTSSAFGARIRQYKQEIQELIKQLRLIYKGPRMVVV